VANRLADRFSSGSICAAGGILLATGLIATALWPIQGTVAPLVASAIVCGIGFGLFQVPNNRTMFLSAPAERSAAAGGMQGTARLAGQTAGALLVAFVLTVAPIGTAPRLAIGLAAVAALIAAWVSWSRESVA
jgi:DHA2 family multidrug resistance protein-like MFS transporter